MTTVTAPASPSTSTRLRARVRVGQALLTVLLVVSGLVGASVAFVDPSAGDRTPAIEAATFALLAVVLGLASVWGGIRSLVVRIGLIALPLFFVAHVAAFGTWIPDAAFAVVAAVGVVLVMDAGRAVRR